MARAMFATLAVFVLASAPTVEGGGSNREFRGKRRAVAAEPVGTMAQLALALTGADSTPAVEARVDELTEALHPVFLALPRSGEGNIDASAVRYLMHRYFLERHAWFVQGWDGSGEDADNSLPQTLLQDEPLADVFSERLAARGLSLREVAVLAAALEILARRETVQRLEFAYRWELEDTFGTRPVRETEMRQIHKVYLVIYLLGRDYRSIDRNTLRGDIWDVRSGFPKWTELLQFHAEVRDEVTAQVSEDERLSFEVQVRIMEEMARRYGRWQDEDCAAIKHGFMWYATPGTGRVPLSKFYTASLPGGWQATESKEYLEELGALDSADPNNPSVVLANYFASPSNCVNSSSYYQFCCISQCEPILSSLERKLATPKAPPQQIVEALESLEQTIVRAEPQGFAAATVKAPRVLSAQLVARLESIAAMHGGHAPLHSRLFRQWMHHAYPAECVLPALSMSQRPRSPDEFEQQTGRSPMLDDAGRQQYRQEESKRAAQAKAAKASGGAAASDEAARELPWSEEEELFVTCRNEGSGESATPGFGSWRTVALVVIAASMAGTLAKEARSGKSKSSLLPVHLTKTCVA